jgi:hypothetical protein
MDKITASPDDPGCPGPWYAAEADDTTCIGGGDYGFEKITSTTWTDSDGTEQLALYYTSENANLANKALQVNLMCNEDLTTPTISAPTFSIVSSV